MPSKCTIYIFQIMLQICNDCKFQSGLYQFLRIFVINGQLNVYIAIAGCMCVCVYDTTS